MESHLIAPVVLDLYSCVILFVILQNQRNRMSKREMADQRAFSWLIRVTVLVLLFEIVTYLLDGRTFAMARPLNLFATVILYVLQAIPPFLYLMYCDVKLAIPTERRRKWLPVYVLPILINTVLSFVVFFRPTFFSISPDNQYVRGPLFLLSYILSYAPVLIAMYHVLRSALARRRGDTGTLIYDGVYWPLLFFPIPSIIGGVIQYLTPNLSLIWPCSVLSLIIINSNIQNIEIMTDALTGLYNRRRTDQYLYRSFTEASESRPLSIAILDIDAFKSINDRFGHASGDEALRVTARTMRRTCHKNDFIGRFGGDEFLIIAPCEREALSAEIDGINAALAEYCAARKPGYSLAMSAGVSQWSRAVVSPDALVSAADAELYRQKATKFARRAADRRERR